MLKYKQHEHDKEGKYTWINIWAASQQNQHYAFVTSMDQDQLAHPSSLIRIHAVCLQTLLQLEKLIVNSMDPDQTARHRLVWIHAGRKHIMLDLSWRGSFVKRIKYNFSIKIETHSWNFSKVHPLHCLNPLHILGMFNILSKNKETFSIFHYMFPFLFNHNNFFI
jgi:hypothetical protein